MSHRNQDRARSNGSLYRLEIQGSIPQARKAWFGADSMAPMGSNTVILLRVVDQSDLHGRLRRIHDLNLTLVAVQRVEEEDSSPDAGDGDHP